MLAIVTMAFLTVSGGSDNNVCDPLIQFGRITYRMHHIIAFLWYSVALMGKIIFIYDILFMSTSQESWELPCTHYWRVPASTATCRLPLRRVAAIPSCWYLRHHFCYNLDVSSFKNHHFKNISSESPVTNRLSPFKRAQVKKVKANLVLSNLSTQEGFSSFNKICNHLDFLKLTLLFRPEEYEHVSFLAGVRIIPKNRDTER